MKILIIDDDGITRALLTQILEAHHYAVDTAADGMMGLELAQTWEYDLILLDLLMPKTDGISTCRRLRSAGYDRPILLLTAKTDSNAVVHGLDAGADDYVTKPFEADPLLARIRALLRRGKLRSPSPLLRWNELCLDPAMKEVAFQDVPVPLTPKEFALLELFLRNPRRAFSRSAILDHVWALEFAPSESAVTNLIKDLRQKLRRAGLTDNLIETVYGLGYRLKAAELLPPSAPVASADQASPPAQVAPANPGPGPSSDRVPSNRVPAAGTLYLQQVLEKMRPSVLKQVQSLHQTLLDLEGADPASELRRQATRAAHSLAGNLGTVGYTQASLLARTIEHYLERQSLELDWDYLHQLMGQLQQTVAKPVCQAESTVLLQVNQLEQIIQMEGDPIRHQACKQAHQLADELGQIGYSQASLLAKTIAYYLARAQATPDRVYLTCLMQQLRQTIGQPVRQQLTPSAPQADDQLQRV